MNRPSIVAKIRQLLTKYKPMIAVLILIVCVQGSVLISQFLATFYMSPSQIGVIRTVESILSIIVMGTALGAPTLAIRETAATHGDSERAHLLKRLIFMELLVGGAVMVICLCAYPFLHSAMLRYAAWIAGVALLSNSIRVIAAFIQGTQRAHEVSVKVIALTAMAITVVCASSYFAGVDGWIAGRYLGELVMLCGLVYGLRHQLFGSGSVGRSIWPDWQLISLGITANLALFIRLLCDNLPILALAAAKIKTDQIGFFGLATLLMMGPNLIFAVTAQVELPHLVLARGAPLSMQKRMRKLISDMLKLGFLFFGLIFIAWVINREFLNISYTRSIDALFAMSFVLPLRAVSISIGTIFTSLKRYSLSVYVNTAEAIFTGIFAYPLALHMGINGVVIVFIVGSVISVLLHSVVLKVSGLLGQTSNLSFGSGK